MKSAHERTAMDDLIERLRELCERHKGVTPGPWELWTSNSWRRFIAQPGSSVCEPVVQNDGHPDLHFRNGGENGHDARAIADVPTMLAALREAADELERLTKELIPPNPASLVITRVREKIDAQAAELERLRGEVEALRAALLAAKRKHYTGEDCWYSCPASGECCDDRQTEGECNCGADQHNAAIDAALAKDGHG